MKLDQFNKDTFKRWLQRQSPNRRIRTGCMANCPIAEAVTDVCRVGKNQAVQVDGQIRIGIIDVEDTKTVGELCLAKVLQRKPETKWVKDFISYVDDLGEEKGTKIVSPKECLGILKEIG